ncbi:MAG: hypothetical protein NVS9B15_12200 [Acidobacteriaceae bacterium]
MSEVNLPAFLASRLRKAGDDLGAACSKMPEERISWHPPVEGNEGRDALDQVVECAYLNEYGAKAFREGAIPAFDADDYKKKKDANRNKSASLSWLRSGTSALASAIEGCPAARLGETITNPFTNQPSTWAEFADFLYWNTVYHEGQVNYIQVLYGDMS